LFIHAKTNLRNVLKIVKINIFELFLRTLHVYFVGDYGIFRSNIEYQGVVRGGLTLPPFSRMKFVLKKTKVKS